MKTPTLSDELPGRSRTKVKQSLAIFRKIPGTMLYEIQRVADFTGSAVNDQKKNGRRAVEHPGDSATDSTSRSLNDAAVFSRPRPTEIVRVEAIRTTWRK